MTYFQLKKAKRSLLKRIRLLLSQRFFIKKLGPFYFLLDSINLVDRWLDTEGYWEKEQVSFLKVLVNRHHCTLFFDVGALWGYYSIQLSEEVSIKRTYLFEPSKTNRYQLFGNLFVNQLSEKTDVFPYAISSFDGKANFFSYPDNNRGRSCLQEKGDQSVEVRKIDSIFDFSGESAAFKIDVEGEELNVIKGMEEFLKNNRCVLQIESFSDNFEELKELLSSMNYNFIRTITEDHYFLKKDMISHS